MTDKDQLQYYRLIHDIVSDAIEDGRITEALLGEKEYLTLVNLLIEASNCDKGLSHEL